jgi:aminoglycoside phosphotransferase (APT) family kinase protein
VDRAACQDAWARALISAWAAAPVWFHGDVAAGNLRRVLAAVLTDPVVD